MRRRWKGLLVLIAVAAPLPQAANAAPPQPVEVGPQLYPRVHRTHDVPIVMRDGTTLYADVLRPATADGKPAPGQFPVILTQTPYNKQAYLVASGALEFLAGESHLMVKRGYVQALVDVRGTGGSEGQWQLFGPIEQADYAEVARWATGLAYADGRLALYGYSYMGINQFFTAASDPPGLKAVFAGIPAYDLYRDVVFHGGDPNVEFFSFYTPLDYFAGLFTNGWPQPGFPPTLSKSPLTSLKILLQHVLGNLRPAFGYLLEGAAEGDIAFDGPFWEERSPKSVLDRVDVPTFVLGAWRDLFQRGEPLLYEHLPLPPGQKQLLMGPWYHITTGTSDVGGPGEPPHPQVLALAWFDHWVKGVDNGIEDYGPITSFQLGADRWETYESFPDPELDYRRYYLSGQRAGSALSLNDGSLGPSPPTAAGTDTWLPIQLNGICSLSTIQWGAGVPHYLPVFGQLCARDNRLNELLSLTYTTPPVAETTHIAGPLSLTLQGSTTARDAGWTATLTDVFPSGRSVPITSGWLVSSRRAVDEGRSSFTAGGDMIVPYHPFTRESLLPVPRGEPHTLNIEIFNIDQVLQPGHRLRLTISAGDFPHLFPAGTGFLERLGGLQAVHYSSAEPSYLTVPILEPS